MRDDHERILDILEAIERIERVSVRGREFFHDDEMAQVWIIHHLQIIGEAVRGISLEFRAANPDIPWSDIVGMRNILVHHYFGIDRDAVWSVVERDLPALKRQLSSRIRESRLTGCGVRGSTISSVYASQARYEEPACDKKFVYNHSTYGIVRCLLPRSSPGSFGRSTRCGRSSSCRKLPSIAFSLR